MHIKFSPQRRDDADPTLSVTGDVLTINGDMVDLSALSVGVTLPASAVGSAWIAGDIARDDTGPISLTILLPHAHNAPEARRFPAPFTVTADGPIALPSNRPETPQAD